MNRRRGLLAALGYSAALGPLPVHARPAPRAAEFKALGDERYQINRILVDKRGRSFTVPGRVLVLDKPLEYLATSPGGRKAYEALLELDATGTELNLACILIGLERAPDVPAWKPLGEASKTGQRVALWLTWANGGQQHRVAAAEALLGAEAAAAAVEWAYTGSFTSMDGSQLAADVTGTLISFVKKDPSGIFEAASDIGPYGAVRGASLLPPEGSAIELVVQAAATTK